MATPNIVPRSDSEGGLGTASKYWASAYIDSIVASNNILISSGSNPNIQLYRSDSTAQLWELSVDSSGRLLFQEAASLGGTQTTKFQIDDDGQVDILGGALTISGDGNNAATLTESSAGDFTIASVDDLRLNAGGNDVVLQGANGDEFGRLTNSSQDLVIQNTTSNKDIRFQGNAGGVTITPLSFDISDSGAATFSSTINGITFYSDASNNSMYTHDVSGTDDTASNNTAYGFTALDAITTGDDNTAVG